MRIDDLRRSLDLIAEEAQVQDAAAHVEAVHARIRHNRRTRAAQTATAAAVCLGAVALALPQLSSDEPAPATDPPSVKTGRPMDAYPAVPTVEEHGIAVYETLATAPLLDHAVSTPGEAELQLTFVPTTTDLVLSDFCTLGPAPSRATEAMGYSLDVYVNGHAVSGEDCINGYGDVVGDMEAMSTSRSDNMRMWEDVYDVEVGEPTTISAVTKVASKGPAVSIPDAQMALAVYEKERATRTVDGVSVDRTLQMDGHLFELRTAQASVVDGGEASVLLDTSGFDTPFLVHFGNTELTGSYRDNQDGRRADHFYSAGSSSWGRLQLVVEPDDEISFDIHGVEDDGGSIYVAIYTPVAD